MSEKIIYIHEGDLLSRKLAVAEGGTFDGWLMRDEAGLLEPFKDISCFVFQRESALRDELERVKDAALAYRDLTICYRIGKTPTEKLFTRLEKAEEALAPKEAKQCSKK